MFPLSEPVLELTKQEYIDALISNDPLKGFITLTLNPEDAFSILDANPKNKERRHVLRSTVVKGEWISRLHLRWHDVVVVRHGKNRTTPNLSFFMYDGRELIPTTARRIDCPASNMHYPTTITNASWAYMGICGRLFANELRNVSYMLENAHIPSIRIEREQIVDGNSPPKNDWKLLLKGLEYWFKIDDELNINIFTADVKNRPAGFDGSVFIGYKHSQILFRTATEDRIEKLWEALNKRLATINDGKYVFTGNKEKLSLRAYLDPKGGDHITITDK